MLIVVFSPLTDASQRGAKKLLIIWSYGQMIVIKYSGALIRGAAAAIPAGPALWSHMNCASVPARNACAACNKLWARHKCLNAGMNPVLELVGSKMS